MKNILVFLLALVCALGTSGLVFAQTNSSTGSITKYTPGQCVNNKGGLWQQISDGTWAPPGDKLNTCASGVPNNWLSSYQYNGWLRSGIDQYQDNQGYTDPYNRTNQYQWGNSYPGGYGNYSDYFKNCVLMQSILPRPECQGFPSYYNNNYNNDNANLFVRTRIGNNAYLTANVNTSSDKISSIAKTALLGWAISRLFN